MVAVADVAEEVRLEAAVREERLVDQGVVEAAHRAGIQAKRSHGDNEIGALQAAVAEGGPERVLLLVFAAVQALGRRIVWEDAGHVLVELRVVGDDRRYGRRHGLVGVAGAERRPQLVLALLGADEDDPRWLAIG